MARIGTLLDEYGRPEDRVQIIRRSKHTTRIRRSADFGRSWAVEDERVDTTRILDDGGRRFKQHSHNPKQATYVDGRGQPQARLKIQRVYSTITKARVYLGDNTWSGLEDMSTSSILFDGGASHGWHPPTWHTPTEHVPSEDEALGAEQDITPAEKTSPAAREQHTEPASSPVKGQRVSYVRVSSADQNLARQREMIGAVDREFVDEISARSRDDRPGLEDCIAYLRHDDTLHVASIDRLARSLVDLRGIIDQITAKGASVHFVKEHLTFSAESTDPRATLMLGVLGSFAEFERSIIRERQAEGIALAKKAGKYKGRKRALTPAQVAEARRRAEAGETKVAIAQDLGIGRATLYRALKDS